MVYGGVCRDKIPEVFHIICKGQRPDVDPPALEGIAFDGWNMKIQFFLHQRDIFKHVNRDPCHIFPDIKLSDRGI